jgi:glycosyltransferase involved in cell wall biosynthesis
MIIAYDLNLEAKCGIATYNKELINNINLLQKKIDPYFLPKNEVRTWPLFYYIDNYLYLKRDLPKKLKEINASIFHCTTNIPIPFNSPCKVVTTIHDIIPLVMYDDYYISKIFSTWFKYNFNYVMNNSDIIITISKFSYSELIKYFPECAKKICVIYQGCNQDFGINFDHDIANSIIKKFGLTKPYILTMGGAEPRKNIQNLINAFECSDIKSHDLIIIGDQWRTLNLRLGDKKNVKTLTNLLDNELVAVYKLASVFVFPSIYEGFGLPVLEAMNCGIPVIAHNGSSIPEVTGTAALLVDMTNMEECVLKIKKLLNDNVLATELMYKGFERVKKFSWSTTANLTIDVYNNIVKN